MAMADYLKSQGISKPLIQKYEEEKSTVAQKLFQIEMMARIRYGIYSSFASRRLHSECYTVLREGIENIGRYAFGERRVEEGQGYEGDPEKKRNK